MPSSTFDGFSCFNSNTIPSILSEYSRLWSVYPKTPLRSRFPYFSFPKSFNRMGTPFSEPTTIFPKSSKSVISPIPRTTYPKLPRFKILPPTFELLFSTASITSSSDKWYCSNFCGSISIWYCVVIPPKLLTSATPGTCFMRGIMTQFCKSVISRSEWLSLSMM
ncbi:hypothetical protein SDC9_183518 [bioreactor metagenome]|uniref:Uncharacterized protein n=1 Tax=bioreactor metagenome TaxID=1076179 RepID=A0A645HK54_9ZZZZ